jgi:hypothetical protein
MTLARAWLRDRSPPSSARLTGRGSAQPADTERTTTSGSSGRRVRGGQHRRTPGCGSGSSRQRTLRRCPVPQPPGTAQVHRRVRHPVAGRLLVRRPLRPPAARHRHRALPPVRAGDRPRLRGQRPSRLPPAVCWPPARRRPRTARPRCRGCPTTSRPCAGSCSHPNACPASSRLTAATGSATGPETPWFPGCWPLPLLLVSSTSEARRRMGNDGAGDHRGGPAARGGLQG